MNYLGTIREYFFLYEKKLGTKWSIMLKMINWFNGCQC